MFTKDAIHASGEASLRFPYKVFCGFSLVEKKYLYRVKMKRIHAKERKEIAYNTYKR